MANLPQGKRSLFVAGLAPEVTPDLLAGLFAPFGTVVSAQLGKERSGVGFVEMAEADEADMAVDNLHDGEFFGAFPCIRLLRPSPKSSSHFRVEISPPPQTKAALSRCARPASRRTTASPCGRAWRRSISPLPTPRRRPAPPRPPRRAPRRPAPHHPINARGTGIVLD